MEYDLAAKQFDFVGDYLVGGCLRCRLRDCPTESQLM